MATEYKRIGGSAINPGSNPSYAYEVPETKSAVISTIHVCNPTSSDATFSVWIYKTTEGMDDWAAWAKDVPIAANSMFSATQGITLEADVRIAVACNPAYSLNFHLFGSEIDA